MVIIPCPAGEETNRIMAAHSSDDGSPAERLRRGIAFKIEGNYDAAVEELKAVLEMDPECASAHREMGLVLGFTGFFDESIDELRKSVQLDPTLLDARNDLALTYAMLGMVDEAKSEFQAVLELDPTNAVALKNMVYFQ
jgi:Flp pilus assembly protein TadD